MYIHIYIYIHTFHTPILRTSVCFFFLYCRTCSLVQTYVSQHVTETAVGANALTPCDFLAAACASLRLPSCSESCKRFRLLMPGQWMETTSWTSLVVEGAPNHN